MPLTPFQREVLRAIVPNRSVESHLAGGLVLNAEDASLRFSNDIDIFHDDADRVATYAEADVGALQAEGCSVEWLLRSAGCLRSLVRRGGDEVRIDWTTDSAFRFFPAERVPGLGYCLHRADLATNKVLALAGRTEVRDLLDILELDEHYLGLGAIIWAACGKDQGFTPGLLLDQSNRHARYRDSDLQGEHLTRAVDLRERKARWLVARDRAEALFQQLPPEEIGCLYLDQHDRPVAPDAASPEFAQLVRHSGSLGGSWPRRA